MAPPLALSVLSEVEDLIDRFGAYAGFASVLGLALLTLLYIAQARELKRLREWAGQMPERVGDLQGRITPNEPSRVTAVAAPRPRPAQAATPAGQAAASQTVAAAAIPPATAAATPAPVAADSPAAEPDPPAAEPAKEAEAGTGAPLVPGKTGSDGSKVADLGETVIQEPARPVNPLDRARQPQTARAAGLPPTPGGEQRQRGPLIAAAIAVAALIALAVYFLAFSGDDGSAPTRDTEPQAVTETTTTTDRTTETTRTTSNSDISVFVLNGTTVNGLARGLANTLEQEGYTIKGTDTASDQTRAATLVMYAAGKRAQALRVARSIGKGADVVEPIDPGAAALSQGASVVILVGADQNVTNPG